MVVYFVIPCYYDDDVLPSTGPVFLSKLHTLIDQSVIDEDSRVIFVNDGSTDRTWEQIEHLHEDDPHCIGINLSQNVGEQDATLAGLFYANVYADCCITMDSDLQDDINMVDQMIHLFAQGNEVVFGVRKSRKKDVLFEKVTSKLFYIVMRIAEPRSIPNHSSFRLMSKRTIEWLREFSEISFFLPVLVASFNLPYSIVYYDRLPRAAGLSGYNFKKRLKLGTNAFLSHIALRQGHPRKKAASNVKIQQILD
ncbi:MAG: glycosyltransferase family 2 protein [Clostridia bacterium]|nr:glycosyltransferase family 2 protein [Clostridia bacterium]